MVAAATVVTAAAQAGSHTPQAGASRHITAPTPTRTPTSPVTPTHLNLLDGVLDQHAVCKPDLLLQVVTNLLNQSILGLTGGGGGCKGKDVGVGMGCKHLQVWW